MSKRLEVPSINLSSKAGTKIDSIFFSWAINTGKIIIVLTELIALGALAYRFWVDHQIIDLHDAIKRDQLLLRSQMQKEEDYRNIQSRLASIQTLNAAAVSKIKIMNTILDAVNSAGLAASPNFSLSGNSINLDGVAPTVFVVNSLVTVLKQEPKIKSITVDTLDSSDAGIKFSLRITI